jgi:hypothetical protein
MSVYAWFMIGAGMGLATAGGLTFFTLWWLL